MTSPAASRPRISCQNTSREYYNLTFGGKLRFHAKVTKNIAGNPSFFYFVFVYQTLKQMAKKCGFLGKSAERSGQGKGTLREGYSLVS
jgi:hypothetical protein